MSRAFWKASVFTSTAYKYWCPNWSESQNQQVYASDATTSGVGYNLQLEAKVLSSEMAEDEFHRRIKSLSRLIDHKFLNEDIDEFTGRAVTLERILRYLQARWEGPAVEFRLVEGERCTLESLNTGELALCVKARLSAVHRHWNPELSAGENQDLYGLCSGRHGHEYLAEVSVAGVEDAESGLVMSREELWSGLNKVLEPLRGQFLNDIIGNTSGETLLLYLHGELKKNLITRRIYRIVLRETRKNSFSMGGPLF